MASNVPKFASFRPKPKPAPEPEKVEVAAKDLKEKARHDRTKSPSRKRPPHAQSPPRKKQHREQSPPSKLYFRDRRGDTDILKYGTVNRYDIPAYRRCGHGYVLGLSMDQKIDRESSTDKKMYITPTTRQRQERLLTAKNVPKESSRALRFVTASKHEPNEQHDFIALPGTGNQKREDDDDEDNVPEVDYRDIQRRDKASELVDPDTQYESDIQSTSVGTEITRKNSQLVRRTREHPEDVEGWLDFIDHQEAMMMLDRTSAELSASYKRHLAEVRIPIYEEALKKIGKDQSSQARLCEGLLNEAGQSWDDAKLAGRWKNVLVKHPHSTQLWFKYLDYVQSNFAKFKYEECRMVFLNCLKTLKSGPTGVTPETILHVLLRLTSMVHGTGYQELALAIWQALLEFHLLQPLHNPPPPQQDTLESFEEFWESEVPRIGEPEAKGWNHYDPHDSPPPGPAPLSKADLSDPVFEDFAKRESEAMLKLRYPGRTTDDVGEDDPFHTVFFSDVKEYLDLLPPETPPSLLVEAFLCFCGLPLLPRVALHQQAWQSDPFLQHTVQPTPPSDEQSLSQFAETLQRFSNSPIQSYQITLPLLFQDSFPLSIINLEPAFIHRLLALLAPSDERIASYHLAFSSRHFPAAVPKIAKQLLKSRPSSLHLYTAYALATSQRSEVDKTEQIFSSALSLHTSDPTAESLELLYAWVWCALERQDTLGAFWRLVTQSAPLNTKENPDPTLILRAQTRFKETVQRALIARDHSAAVLSTSLLALSIYLAAAGDLTATLPIFSSLPASLPTTYRELAAQNLARLLTHHVSHAPIVKAHRIRATLAPLVAQFPNNTLLLALFASVEARFSIDDRVRDVLRSATTSHARGTAEEVGAAGWMFAVHFETLRGEHGGATSHSVRALYERAVAGSAGTCAAVWGEWLAFEVQQLQRERGKWGHGFWKAQGEKTSKAKEREREKEDGEADKRVQQAERRVKAVFFAGMKRVPGSKEFVMRAFTDAKDVLSGAERQAVLGVMMEKEHRVYIETEGVAS